jgi:hypothetical protein
MAPGWSWSWSWGLLGGNTAEIPLVDLRPLALHRAPLPRHPRRSSATLKAFETRSWLGTVTVARGAGEIDNFRPRDEKMTDENLIARLRTR